MHAVIHIPGFHLQAALRAEPGAFAGPAALLDEDPRVKRSRDRIRIIQLSEAARKAAVEPGMTATQGQARCTDLRVVHRSNAAEAAAQETLLQWASSLSPRIESTADGVCTVDLAGTRHAYDPELLGEQCVDAFARMNLVATAGIADNPELALLAARFADPIRVIATDRASIRKFLAPLPIEALSASREIVAVLRMWGLRKLGELAALPKEGVIERLGADVLPLWCQLGGGAPRPLNLHRPAEILTEATDFDHHVERLDALLFVLNRFLQSLEVRLAELYLVADSMTLELRFENGDRHERAFRIPEPSRDVERLLRMLHTHLESFRAESAITAIRLTVSPARRVQQQLDLFQPSLRDPNRFAETLSRLEALLGPGRVGSPEVLPTHRPDAFTMVAFNPDPDAPLPEEKQAVRFGPALRRFRPPVPVKVDLAKDRAEESLVRLARSRVRSAKGPWLSSGDWWDRQSWHRREWDVELASGTLHRVARQDGRWQIDAEYD